MGTRPTLYHFYAGTSFQDWTLPFTLLLFFFMHFVYYRRSSRNRNVYLGIFLCHNYQRPRRVAKGGEGASLQERGQKGSCTTHGFGEGTTQSSFAFFLDDKYVR
jgi:hypothetical protein